MTKSLILVKYTPQLAGGIPVLLFQGGVQRPLVSCGVNAQQENSSVGCGRRTRRRDFTPSINWKHMGKGINFMIGPGRQKAVNVFISILSWRVNSFSGDSSPLDKGLFMGGSIPRFLSRV